MSRSLLIVNFLSADLTREAIATARAASSEPLEVVVVDNSVSSNEVTQLQSLGIDHLVIAERNSGYAGGVNLGLPHCSGETIVIANPDVSFAEDSIDLLVDELDHPDVAMSGPAFFWDEALEWHLPPPERMTFAEQWSRRISSRVPPLAGFRDRRLLRNRLKYWNLARPANQQVLSGAVMAMRTSELREVGGMDDSYALYFEELDLMRRLSRRGRRLRYVPSARARHIWSQSAKENPMASTLFAASRKQFHRRWQGRVAEWLLRVVPEVPPQERAPITPLSSPAVPLRTDDPVLVEISDTPRFVMAAGTFARGGGLRIPREILESCPLDVLYCRITALRDFETRGVYRYQLK
jgi:N-acetylglucosaminyl-diphospho-decaprenol L-rhamnosyltransferase